jgi:hypothetical protein
MQKITHFGLCFRVNSSTPIEDIPIIQDNQRKLEIFFIFE